MSRFALTTLAALVSPVLAVGTADAGKVIILAVAGDREGELEDGLMSIVEDRHDTVTSGEAERVARRQGIEDLDGPALGKLARKLGADAVIEGSVSREDEGFLLVVRIRGQNGKTVKKISVDLPKPRLSAKARRRLGTGILDGIDRTLGIEDEERIEAEDEEAPKAKKAKKAKKTKKAKKAKKAKRSREVADEDEVELEDEASDDDDADDDEGGDDDDRVAFRDDESDVRAALGADDDEDGERRGGKAPRSQPALRVALGPSATMRTLAFTSRADFPQAPLGYQSSMVPGANLAGEVYPLAISSSSMAAGLGIGFEYDQTIGLTTRSSDAEEVKLPTDQKHWSVGARFRIPFGKKPNAASATIGAGYGKRTFVVDRSGLPEGAELDMPDVDYTYYDPGLAVRVPVGDRMAIHAGGKFLAITSAGPIQEQTSYGGAKLTGLEATAGFELKATPNVFVDVGGTFTQIGYAFVGNGDETNNRDLQEGQDVGGASDRYLGVIGSIGYLY